MLFGLAALVVGLWWAHAHHALPELGAGVAIASAAGGTPGFGGPPRTFLFDTWRPTSGVAVVAGTALNVTATTTTVQDLSIAGSCTIGGVDCATAFAPSPTPTSSPADPLLFAGGQIATVGIPDTFASDTFTRANTANIAGTAVQVGGGTWLYHNNAGGACTPGIVSNQLKLTVVGACGGDLYTDVAHTDGAVSLTIQTGANSSGDAAGPVIRLNPATGNGYMLTTVNGNAVRIKTLTAWGQGGVLALYSVALNVGDTVTLSANGSEISAFLNSTLLGSVTDSTYTTGTSAGIYLEGSSPRTYTDWIAATVPVPIGLEIVGNYAGADTSKIVLGENAPGIALYDKDALLVTAGFPDAANDYFTVYDPNFGPTATIPLFYSQGGSGGGAWGMNALSNTGTQAVNFSLDGDLETAALEAGGTASITIDGATGTITLAGNNVDTDRINIGSSSTLLYRYSYAAVLDFPLHGPLNQSILTITGAGSVAGDHCKVTTNVSTMNGTVDCHVTGAGANNISIVETCVNGAAGTCDTLSQAYHVEVTNQ